MEHHEAAELTPPNHFPPSAVFSWQPSLVENHFTCQMGRGSVKGSVQPIVDDACESGEFIHFDGPQTDLLIRTSNQIEV